MEWKNRPEKIGLNSYLPITKSQLEETLLHGCDNPECECHEKPQDSLCLSCKYCNEPRVFATYPKGGIVKIDCPSCGRQLCLVEVAGP